MKTMHEDEGKGVGGEFGKAPIPEESPIREYKHPLLSGKPCMIHNEFVASMDLFCRYLEIVKCRASINSSYRPNADNIKGAIVKPARRSNHMIGCGIDCNLIDSKGKIWSSEDLEVFAPKSPNYNPKIINDISQLLGLVRRSKVLRWGGDFTAFDTVHFDNGINISNPERWDEIYNEIWKKEV